MTELEILEGRIIESGVEGVETEHIREDYEPAGDMIIKTLCASGNFVQRRTPMHDSCSTWRVFSKDMKPY